METLQPYLQLPGLWPSAALILACTLLLHASRTSMWRVALLALPGTIAHECAHLLVGTLLLAQPAGFSVWPKRAKNGWVLGSVTFRRLGLFNGAFVALAPVLLLPLAWLCLRHLTLPFWLQQQWGGWLLSGYLAATALYAALPSLADIKIGFPSLLFYAALAGLCWYALRLF